MLTLFLRCLPEAKYDPAMPHLVAPISSARHGHDGRLSIAGCEELIRDAHDVLAARGIEAVNRAALGADLPGWGGRFKRVRVELPPEDRPVLLRDANKTHSLVEIANQCATMERLLDGLRWAASDKVLSEWTVVTCHPTTSSGVGEKEHDLELAGPDGAQAWFELSDVASPVDGNRKEERDLVSLGLLRRGQGDDRFLFDWPAARCFLIVASEFALKLQNASVAASSVPGGARQRRDDRHGGCPPNLTLHLDRTTGVPQHPDRDNLSPGHAVGDGQPTDRDRQLTPAWARAPEIEPEHAVARFLRRTLDALCVAESARSWCSAGGACSFRWRPGTERSVQ